MNVRWKAFAAVNLPIKLKPPAAKIVIWTSVVIAIIGFSILNATLVDDDIYIVEYFSNSIKQPEFFHTLAGLLFNFDIHNEYRLFGLSRVLQFLFWLILGSNEWPYAVVIAASQIATAWGIYRLLRRFNIDGVQSGALAVVWLLSPFAATSGFWHYSYFLLPYQLTVGSALVLQRLHDPKTRQQWGWRALAAVLGVSIAWTGEGHMVASLAVLGLVAVATPSIRPVRPRCLDLAAAVLPIVVGIALHRWVWEYIGGGYHDKLRFVFALPSFKLAASRMQLFINSVTEGLTTQIVPIIRYAGSWCLVTAVAAGLICWATVWSSRDAAEGSSASLLKRNWPEFQVCAVLFTIFLASLSILWLLCVLTGDLPAVLFRRYGYGPYTLGAMTVVAFLTTPPIQRKLGVLPGMVACGAVIWLWLTLNAVCWPVIRSQDRWLWSAVAAAIAQKPDASILFAAAWDRPDLPGFDRQPGLRGPHVPEIFESPLMAYFWESKYAVVMFGAHHVGYQALPEEGGRIRLIGDGPPVTIQKDSLIVVDDPNYIPPRLDFDLRRIIVFTQWDAFRASLDRDLVGSWQTPNGKIDLTTDDASHYFATDQKGNTLPVTINSDVLTIPSRSVEGRINALRIRIEWNDGSAWTRPSPVFENAKYKAVAAILGQWHFGDKNCSMVFDLNTGDLVLINEQGIRVVATRRGDSIFVNDWHISGQLSPDARVINWSNGTVWRR